MKRLLRQGRILLLLALALAVILPGAAVAQRPQHDGSQRERPTFEARADREAVPGQIIVKFKENLGAAARGAVRREEGLEKKKELDLIGAEVAAVEGQSVEDALRELNDRPDVEYAERDYIVHAAGYADEPSFSQLWGLHNPANDVDINGLEASAITQGDPNLVVAVIDTGVDFSHPDLTDRRWVNPGEFGGGKETNGVDDDGNGYVDDVNGADTVNDDGDPFDDNSHGTHVSGTIAASVNGQGVVGVAPNVKIMALKFLDADGFGSTSDAIEAIEYAKSKGAKISNNSWGYLGPPDVALRDAINNSGQLFVAAAMNNSVDGDAGGFDGNGDPNHAGYPGGYNLPNVLSVAANDQQGNKAWFSNFGATSVDISAPGVDILSSVPGNGFAFFNGTSMASPHAAGVAALAASEDPALLSDPIALKDHVMDTGKPLPAMAGMTVTGDMVDARAAVTGPDSTAPKVVSTTPKANANGIAPRTNINASFSEAMTAGSINTSTVKLMRAGTTTVIPAAVTYDATAKKAVLNPNSNLRLGTRYKAVVTTGARDLADNLLDQNPTLSGNQPKKWFFTVRN
jgi:subtilisin family serine protease